MTARFFSWIRRRLSAGNNLSFSGIDAGRLMYEVHDQPVQKNYDRARELSLQAMRFRELIQDPSIVGFFLSSLATWLLTDQYPEAISFFSKHFDRYPQDFAALRWRAAALWYMGKLQEAINDYSRVLELAPNDILSLSGRGQVLAALGESAKALDDLNLALEAIKEAPRPDEHWAKWYEHHEAFVRNGRAVALAGLGEHSSAMREFDVSIGLCPDNAWVYYNRATVLESAGERHKASLDYQTALAKDGPSLNLIQRERAQARLQKLLG